VKIYDLFFLLNQNVPFSLITIDHLGCNKPVEKLITTVIMFLVLFKYVSIFVLHDTFYFSPF